MYPVTNHVQLKYTQKKPTSLDKIKKLGHVKSSLLKIVLIMSLGLKAKLEVEIVSLCSV